MGGGEGKLSGESFSSPSPNPTPSSSKTFVLIESLFAGFLESVFMLGNVYFNGEGCVMENG